MSAESLALMVTDAHHLVREHDNACKAHAGIRNAAIQRLYSEYGWSADDIAAQCHVPGSTVRVVLFKRKPTR